MNISKYLNPTTLITGMIAAAIMILLFNKNILGIRKYLGGAQ